jgi:hypothetical protein
MNGVVTLTQLEAIAGSQLLNVHNINACDDTNQPVCLAIATGKHHIAPYPAGSFVPTWAVPAQFSHLGAIAEHIKKRTP